MEYVDGRTLTDRLEEGGPLELEEASEVAGQLLAGLESIHQAGLVHRDLKPSNVMLTRAGRVVVMDFGIAIAASEVRSRTLVGTPAYMAPEQLRGEAPDARSDVFAAGLVLAQMLGSERGGVHAGDQARPRWRAHRRGRKRLRVQRCFAGEVVQIGRYCIGITVAAQIGTYVLAGNPENIRPFLGSFV